MATPVEQLSFVPTSATTKRSLGDWTGDIINVKNFGAVGNGVADDYAAIQAAFNAAFGTAASPHGNGGGPLNKPVFFPAGTYKTLTPLSVTAVWGGKIFGAGQLSTIIDYQGGLAPVNAEGWTPTLWLNGCNYTSISDISFQGDADTTTHKTVCLWFGPDGANGGTSAHANLLSQVSTIDTSYGVIHGSTNSQANSENTYIGCNFSLHETAGFFASGANSLNIRLIGSTASSCGTGIKTNNSATIPFIMNPAFADNSQDIDLAASGISTIIGARTESAAFLKTVASNQLINCQQAWRGDTVTGSTSGTTLTVSALGAQGAIIRNGMIITGTDGVDSLPTAPPNTTRIVRQLTGSSHGTGTYELSQAAAPGDINAGSSFTLISCFCEMPGAATVVMDSCGSAYNVGIIGYSNSVLSMRNNCFFDQVSGEMAANLLSYYIGQILEYDIAGRDTFTVAKLPTAASPFKGVRMFVTDATVTAVSSNFGTTVAGTGANAVPVFCDGSNWKIG